MEEKKYEKKFAAISLKSYFFSCNETDRYWSSGKDVEPINFSVMWEKNCNKGN